MPFYGYGLMRKGIREAIEIQYQGSTLNRDSGCWNLLQCRLGHFVTHTTLSHVTQIYFLLREGTFLIAGWGGGRGGPGLRKGGSLVKFLEIGEGQTSFVRSRGGSYFFRQGKNYSMSLLLKSTLLLVNKHAKSLEN